MNRSLRDAITRLKAAMLDLIAAGRHTEANEVRALVERLEAGR